MALDRRNGFSAIPQLDKRISEILDNNVKFEKKIITIQQAQSDAYEEYAAFKELTAGNFEAVVGDITYLRSFEGRIDNISGDLSTYKEYVGEKFTGLEGGFQELSSTTIKTTELAAEVAKLGYVESNELTAKIAELGYLTADSADLKYAALGDFNAVSGRVGTLEGDFSSFVSGEFGTLKSGVADIQTLMFGSASGNSITTEFANAVASMIGDGYITNAMIDNLSFDKITGFDVNTTNITVHSQDGKSTWSDNTIQISDANRVRVQIGKDASNDYNMYVWDASGNLMFDALGLTESGIRRDIIKDSMVASDAAINASKLDIDSLFRVVNEDGSHTLNATKVYFSAEEQTLDVLFNSMTTDIEGVKGDASSALTQITAVNGQINTVVQNMETMGSELSDTKTMASQTANKFDWLVASGTSSSDFTLTDRVAELTAEKINLKGLVTFSGLDADAQSKVNSAVSNASSALSVANTAKSIANTAKSTADTAAANASSALATANSVDSVIAAWCKDNDRTVIDGAKIYTGSITADKLSVTDLKAIGATIGGFTIGTAALYNGATSLAGADNSVYLGLDGISCGTKFKVDKTGALTTENANINGDTVVTGNLITNGSVLICSKNMKEDPFSPYMEFLYGESAGVTIHGGQTLTLSAKRGMYIDAPNGVSIDGSIQSYGNYVPTLLYDDAGYYGLADGHGSDELWMRAPKNGFLPHKASAGSACFIGANGWPFSGGFFNYIKLSEGQILCHIRFGTISITPSAANTPTGKTFSFQKGAFSAAFVTPNTTVPGKTVTGCAVSNIYSDGLTVYLTRTNTTATTLYYLALG